jgi:PhzF family phenazine biosynthesis protein
MTTLHVIDAFTQEPFRGNPAAVCILQKPPLEAWMPQVAREMNLSETSFVWPLGEGTWSLRWLTPAVEVDLCGHATLAAAHALWENGHVLWDEPISFQTRSGLLHCRREPSGAIIMDFPASSLEPVDEPLLAEILGCSSISVQKTPWDYLVEIADASTLWALAPDFTKLAKLPVRGIMVTCRGENEYDFLSRFFAPACGVNEDPVTGSAHAALAPFWAAKLGKTAFRAYQASARGGDLTVSLLPNDRVKLSGHAVTVSRVTLQAPSLKTIRIPLALGLELVTPELNDARELFHLTSSNDAHLRRWLPWLNFVKTPADSAKFIVQSRERLAGGSGVDFLIKEHGKLCGIVGFNTIKRLEQCGHIGYWLSEAAQHRGIMTQAVAAVIQYGFETLGLKKVEIHAATGNAPSQAVAKRLSFTECGFHQQVEWLYDHYVDHTNFVLYRS